MLNDLDVVSWYTLNEHLNDSDYILMQNTWLKDSKWVDIYEFDIVLIDWRRTICKYIEWEFKLQRETDDTKNYCIWYAKDYKIIWNIYEN
jgi:hypothetical protein